MATVVRELEPFERQAHLSSGHGLDIPNDCDLCQSPLQARQMAPQTIQWRTKEREVDSKISAVSAVTVLAGVVVKEKTVAWQQQTGTYFLCDDCRKKLRPTLGQALPHALGAAVLAFPLFYFTLGELPLWLTMIFTGIAFGLGMLFGFRNRHRGYPTNQGYRVHSTTFDSSDRSVGNLLAVLMIVLLPFVTSLFGPSETSNIDHRLTLADVGRYDAFKEDDIRKRLSDLSEQAHEKRTIVGEALLSTWQRDKATVMVFYPNVRAFIDGVKATLASGEMGKDIKVVIERMGKDTPGVRLARRYEGKLDGPFGSKAAFDTAVTSIRLGTNSKDGEIVLALEKLHDSLKPLGKVDFLKVVKKVAAEVAYGPKQDLGTVIPKVTNDISRDLASYR